MGVFEVLFEISRVWFNVGAGIVFGFDINGILGNKVEDWVDEFESVVEFCEMWV